MAEEMDLIFFHRSGTRFCNIMQESTPAGFQARGGAFDHAQYMDVDIFRRDWTRESLLADTAQFQHLRNNPLHQAQFDEKIKTFSSMVGEQKLIHLVADTFSANFLEAR